MVSGARGPNGVHAQRLADWVSMSGSATALSRRRPLAVWAARGCRTRRSSANSRPASPAPPRSPPPPPLHRPLSAPPFPSSVRFFLPTLTFYYPTSFALLEDCIYQVLPEDIEDGFLDKVWDSGRVTFDEETQKLVATFDEPRLVTSITLRIPNPAQVVVIAKTSGGDIVLEEVRQPFC